MSAHPTLEDAYADGRADQLEDDKETLGRVGRFLLVYAMYRRAGHRRRYAARIAFGCAFQKIPF